MTDVTTIIDAQAQHVEAVAEIYNQALVKRTATFETKPRSGDDVASWLNGDVALKVALVNGTPAGFAKVSSYRDRPCYAGIREYSVYVGDDFHRRGIGRQLMQVLIDDCRKAGVWKLLSRIFPENIASIELAKQLGFRIVGTYQRHGQLDGIWKDCVIVELCL